MKKSTIRNKAALYSALGIMLFQNALPLTNVYAQAEPVGTEELTEQPTGEPLLDDSGLPEPTVQMLTGEEPPEPIEAEPNQIGTQAVVASGEFPDVTDSATWTLDDQGVLTVSSGAVTITGLSKESAPWYPQRTSIKKVVFESGAYVPDRGSLQGLFYDCSNITEVQLANLDTRNALDMMEMFTGCSSLQNLDLSTLKTEKVDYFTNMFRDCSSLETLDLSAFQTTQAKNMGGMFYNCESLQTVNLQSFDTSRVENMFGMFRGCSKLENLNLSNFRTNNVIDMSGMFGNCSSLKELDLSNFENQKVTTMQNMFSGASSLESLTLVNPDTGKSFGTSKVESMYEMFNECSSLSVLDLSNFETGTVKDMRNMFSNCSSLSALDLSNFDTTSVTNMVQMFTNCSSLSTLDLSNFDTTSVTNMLRMFANCSNLSIIDLSSFSIGDTTGIVQMFRISEGTKPLLIRATDEKLQNYDFNGDNCVPFYGTANAGDKGKFDPDAVKSLVDAQCWTTEALYDTDSTDKLDFTKPVYTQNKLAALKTGLAIASGYHFTQWEPAVTGTDLATQLSASYTAQYATDAEFTYVINNSQATITGIKSVPSDWDGHLVIPNTIEDNGNMYLVVAIGKKAFFERADIKAVIFEPNDNLTSIGEEAFMRTSIAALNLSGCTALTDIGSRAFESTSQLVDVTFPAKLKNLGERAFWESGIRVADLSECSDLETIKQQTFEHAQQLHTVKLPPKLTSIENKAFKGTNLQAIDFSNTPKLTTIGTEALALKDNAALSEILTGANFQQICDALVANKDTGVKTDVVIKGHADISMNLDGSDYTATQSKEINVQDLYDNEKPTYGNVVFSDELIQAIATLPTGSTIVWKDAQDEEVDLTTAGEHIGPFTGTVIGVNRNLEVSGDNITEDTDYRFNDVDKTLTIISNQPMTIKNADLTAASDYRIIVPAGVTAELTFSGIYIDVDSDRDAGGTFSVEAGGKASVTLAEGTVNTLKNTSGTNSRRGYGILNRDNFAADSLILKGTGTLKSSGGIAGYSGSGTIESGNYEFTSLVDGIELFGQTAMEIQGGKILAKGDTEDGIVQALMNKNGLHVSDGFLRVETSRQDGESALNGGKITGGTVEVANTNDGIAALYTEITGGSIKVLQGTTQALTPANAKFIQKIEHSIPAEGSDVTIKNLTDEAATPNNFKLSQNHSDNDKLSFYLVKGKDYEVKIKDQDNAGKEALYKLTWSESEQDWTLKDLNKTYAVTLASTENGRVTSDKEAAKAGETVLLQATPNSGYHLKSIQATAGTDDVPLQKYPSGGPNAYTFTMPEADVTISAEFEKDVEKATLKTAIDKAQALTESEYTPNSWQTLTSALTNAETVYGDADATQVEVDNAVDMLNQAIDNLQLRSDFTALEALYEEENGSREQSEYTNASWSAYDDAMKAAETVLANLNATQQQVDDAKTALETAVAGLQKFGDKTALNQLIKEMEALKEADFTKDSWTALQNALSAAKKIAANDQATEKEVAKAQEELGTAKNNLVNIKDLRDLSNKTFEEDLYTKASWNAYDKAHEAAKTVLANPAASQKAVDDAQTALQNAIDSLVYKAKTDLDELINEAEALDQDDYTSASWGDLKEVLEAAKTTANDPDATPEELQEAEDNLQNAIDDLVEKGDTSDLQTIVDEANKLKEEDFTPESWKNLTDARDDAQGLIDSGDASKQAVKEAEDKLRSALDGLKKKADYSALQKLYDAEIKAQRNEKDYTKASWGVYDKAIKAAEQMLKNPNATQKQVDAAEAELKTAVAGLQKLGNRTDLQNLIAELEKLKEKDYTKDSWTALQNALSAAKKVAANNQATDNEVAKAQEALGKGKNQLVNLKELKDLYENETGKRRDDQLYTADTWKAYQKALDNASEILVKDNATQKQVDDAQTALTKAVKNLETKKHAVLDQLVKDEQEKNRQEKDYTADSWKIYENALKQAEQVLMDHDATDDEITTAMKNLQSAISGLKKATRQGSGGNPSSGSTTKTYPTTSRTTTPSTTKSTSGSLPKTGMITTGLPMGLGAGIIAAVSAIFKRRRNKK